MFRSGYSTAVRGCNNYLKILLILFLVINTSRSYSQSGSLSGHVLDIKTGEQIEGAAVIISVNRLTYTNSRGNFIFKGLDEGKYEIKISHVGYKPLSGVIAINGNIEKEYKLESSPIEFDEVIVSTPRFDKYLRYSPFSEILLSREKLQEKPFISLAAALKNEPGISLINEGAWGTEISIRGLSRENIVALIDGNRIATSTDVAARFSMVDLNDIDKIEVIKGASSSIYGSGATGGIVNVITRAPQLQDHFSISGNFSSGFNTVNNLSASSASIYTGASVWSSKLTASFRKAGNIMTPAGELKNSQFEDYSISGSFNTSVFNNHLLKLNYQLFRAEDVGIPGSLVFPSFADVRYPKERRELFSAGYEIKNLTSVVYKLSLKYSYQVIDRDVENIPHIVQNIAGTGNLPPRRVSVLKITPEASHSNNNLQLQGNFLINDFNNLAAGLDFWDRTYKGFRNKYQRIESLNDQNEVVNTVNKIIGEMPLPDSKYKSLGLFLQDDNDFIKDKLTLSLGARVDLINIKGSKAYNPIYEIVNGITNNTPAGQKVIWENTDINDAAYSSNLGLRYSVLQYLDLTLSLGYAFRSPSLEERFQYIDQGSYVLLGGPNLKSEISKSADLGFRFYMPDFKIITSFYLNYFTDLVSERTGAWENKPAYIKTNIGKAKIYGFDVRSDYNFYDDLVLHGVISYVRGDDITGNSSLPGIPPLNASIGLALKILEKLELDISSDIAAVQNNIADGEIPTPGYTVFNLSLSTETINISSFSIKLFTGVENIFNKNYLDHLSALRGNIISEPGRNFYIKLSTGF